MFWRCELLQAGGKVGVAGIRGGRSGCEASVLSVSVDVETQVDDGVRRFGDGIAGEAGDCAEQSTGES